ncbi:hypothetical protein V8C42DRAFT_337783 [Trichoderma barbatum]
MMPDNTEYAVNVADDSFEVESGFLPFDSDQDQIYDSLTQLRKYLRLPPQALILPHLLSVSVRFGRMSGYIVEREGRRTANSFSIRQVVITTVSSAQRGIPTQTLLGAISSQRMVL